MTERLLAVASMVPACETFYDIGTDHGKLPAFLLREGRCNRAVACDISRKSLYKAEKLFEKLGLYDRADFHCGDGLENLYPERGDCVAVCGLGAFTILNILRDGLPCPIVLSTNVDVEVLRESLPGRGYRIEREVLTREERRFYVTMRVSVGEEAPYIGADAYIGRGLKADPLLADYIAFRERVARAAAVGGDAVWRERLGWIEDAKRW